MSNSNIEVKYPYPQQPSIVTGPVADGISKLQAVGIDPARILDSYLDAQTYAHIAAAREQQKKEAITNPYRYLAKVNGMTSDQLKVTNAVLERTYNDVLLAWKDIPPLSFLAQYDGHLLHEKNESGIENGMIASRLFRGVNPSTNLLIIEPSPSFVKWLSANEYIQDRTLTLAYMDPRVAKICALHNWPDNISVVVYDNVVWNHHPCVCLFGTRMDYTKVVTVMEAIHKENVPSRLYLLAPTVFLNRRADAPLRNLILEHYNVIQIVIMDIDRKDDERLRRCMVVLGHQPPSGNDIPVERVTKRGKQLVASPLVYIPYYAFAAGDLTLQAMYADAVRVPNTQQRNRSSPVPFSAEIQLWYTIETLERQNAMPQYRALYRYYDFPTESQERRNKIARGRALTGRICGKVVSDPVDVHNCIDELILPSNEDPKVSTSLASAIRESVVTRYGNSPISLKSLWFVNIPNLVTRDLYDHSLCYDLFCGGDWAENPLCNLIVGVSTASDIKSALETYAVENIISPTSKAKILDQLHLLWNLYVKTHVGVFNPVSELIGSVRESADTKEVQRDALVARSWDFETARRASQLIDTNVSYNKMAMAAKLKLFCGLDSGVISALTIGDYVRVPSYNLNLLNITKSMPQTGSAPKSFATESGAQGFAHPWKNRQVPIPQQLASTLEEIIHHALAELSDYGITGNDVLQYPLLSVDDDIRKPILTRRINEYCAKIVDLLHVQKMVISCPEDGITTDLSVYGKDIWVSNYKYHAAHTCNLDAGSISYLSGTKPDTVVSTNYRGFSHPLQLKELQLRAEQMVDAVTHPDDPIDDTIHSFATKGRRRRIPYIKRNSSTEMEVDVILSDNKKPIEFSINAPHGAFVQVQYIKEDNNGEK